LGRFGIATFLAAKLLSKLKLSTWTFLKKNTADCPEGIADFRRVENKL
jgi:hypothetical protein